MSKVDKNLVTIRTGGRELKGWTDVTITAGITMAARSFSVGVTYRWPEAKTVLNAFDLGDPCEVWIGSDPVITGYIFANPISYGANFVRVQVAGRSKTADIIDCCPMAAAVSSATSEDSSPWASMKLVGPSGPVSTPATPKAAQWKNQKVEQIAADLCAPYGVEVVAQVSTGDPIPQHAVQPGETVFESISRLLTIGQLMATDDEAGRLVFTKPGALGEASGGLELGVNILSGSMKRDASNVFSSYIVEGQRAGSDLAFGAAAAHLRAEIEDVETKRYRMLALTHSGSLTPDLCRQIASFEQRRRRALLRAVSYTVVGWRDAQGRLWRPNTLVAVRDGLFGFERTLLLSEVTYTLSEQGMSATLNLAPQDAFEAEPPVDESTEAAEASWISEVK